MKYIFYVSCWFIQIIQSIAVVKKCSTKVVFIQMHTYGEQPLKSTIIRNKFQSTAEKSFWPISMLQAELDPLIIKNKQYKRSSNMNHVFPTEIEMNINSPFSQNIYFIMLRISHMENKDFALFFRHLFMCIWLLIALQWVHTPNLKIYQTPDLITASNF